MSVKKPKLVTKTFDFKVKALHDDDEDFFTFEGYASTFGNEDLGGDIVRPGAFQDSILDISRSGRHLPILWQH